MTDVTAETFLSSADAHEIAWAKPPATPVALQPDRVLIAGGADALEVAVATAQDVPKIEDVRRLWNLRWNRRAAARFCSSLHI
jgi:hypothetical protein